MLGWIKQTENAPETPIFTRAINTFVVFTAITSHVDGFAANDNVTKKNIHAQSLTKWSEIYFSFILATTLTMCQFRSMTGDTSKHNKSLIFHSHFSVRLVISPIHIFMTFIKSVVFY